MKVGSKEIPDVLYTKEGDKVFMADMLADLRQEFQSLESSLGASSFIHYIAMMRTFRKMKSKYKQIYFNSFFFNLMVIIWAGYVLSGERYVTARFIHRHFYPYSSDATSFLDHIKKYASAGLMDIPKSGEIYLTDKGIAVFKVFMDEYSSYLIKNQQLVMDFAQLVEERVRADV